MRQRKNSPTSVGIEPKTSRFDCLLLYRYTNGQSNQIGGQVVVDYGENVKGTNECCAASTKDTNDR